MVLNNPTLRDLVDWSIYRHDVLEIPRIPFNFLFQEPWQTRVIQAVIDDPAKLGMGFIIKAARQGGLPLWLDPMASCPKQTPIKWFAELPLLLLLLQVYSAHRSVTIPTEDDADARLFMNFLDKPHDVSIYKSLLERVMECLDKENNSVKAIWHGKLLFLALTYECAQIGEISPSIVLEYFSAYAPAEYQFGTISALGLNILQSRILAEPIDAKMELQLTLIQKRFLWARPFWGPRESFLRYWRRTLPSRGIISPPLEPCELLEVCQWLSQIATSKRWMIHSRFANPFLINDGGNLAQCDDVYCLLKILPPKLYYLGAFRETPEGFRIGDVELPLFVWECIGLLISWGYIFTSRDVFCLSDSMWSSMYDVAIGDETPEFVAECDYYCEIGFIIGILKSHDFFQATASQYIK
jgi:hypothetical protein